MKKSKKTVSTKSKLEQLKGNAISVENQRKVIGGGTGTIKTTSNPPPQFLAGN